MVRRETAEKLLMTVRTETGTQEQPVPGRLKKAPVLNNARVKELARLGREILTQMGNPGADWVKLEVLGDTKTLLPDPIATTEALSALAEINDLRADSQTALSAFARAWLSLSSVSTVALPINPSGSIEMPPTASTCPNESRSGNLTVIDSRSYLRLRCIVTWNGWNSSVSVS